MCSSLPTLHHERGYTQSVRGLLGSEACRVGSRLHSRRALFEGRAFTSVPHGAGPISAEAERQLHSWGSQLDLAEGMETGGSLSSSSPARSTARSLGSEARSAVSSPRGAGSALLLSSSEEVDVESVEYSPLQSPQYEELLEVVTRAVAKLNIDWPAEKQAKPQKSKLDERFLRIFTPEPAFFFLISPPRCRDHGRNHSRPTYSSPPLIIMAMWRSWVIAVTERCPGLSRRLRAICPPAWHRL